jgi:hypothetical protein
MIRSTSFSARTSTWPRKKGNTTTGNEVSLKTPSSWKAVLWIKKLGVLITAVQLGQSQTI